MYLRNNFIAYQKLKIIIYNIIKKNQDMSLYKLYTYFRDYKLRFKKFIYLTNLSSDKNIGRLSNFFASQNPIILREIKEIDIIDEYSELENDEVKSNENNGEDNEEEDNKEEDNEEEVKKKIMKKKIMKKKIMKKKKRMKKKRNYQIVNQKLNLMK